MCFTENITAKEAEECYAHVINTMDNDAVGKGLSDCKTIQKVTYENLRQVLTVYRMSCLIVRIILCMNTAEFKNLYSHIASQEQIKQLSNLYYGECAYIMCIHT